VFQSYQTPIILEPSTPAKACVIWMHGLGASGDDFLDFSRGMQKRLGTATRFILPHATAQPVTVNQGYSMPAWYDIRSPNLSKHHDAAGILKSMRYIHHLMDEAIKSGIPTARMVIAGFSQGGVMSLSAALSYPHALAGCLVLSSYFADDPKIITTFKDVNQSLPILWLHGRHDQLVSYANAERSVESLRVFHPSIELKSYPVAHTVSPQAIPDIAAWLDAVLCR
jgi:phospholipase/carboxylesterase